MIGNIAIKTEAQTVFNVNDIKRPSFYSSLFTCILFGKIETHGCNVRWIFRWFIHHNETNVEHTETEDVQLKMVMVHFIAELWHSQWNIVFKTNGTYNGARNDAWWESEMCFLKIHTTQLFHILKWNSGIAAIPEISPCARAMAILPRLLMNLSVFSVVSVVFAFEPTNNTVSERTEHWTERCISVYRDTSLARFIWTQYSFTN